jgi:hypothetical protein
MPEKCDQTEKASARRYRKQSEKEKAVIEKVQCDRAFMARPIKEENVNKRLIVTL